MIKTFLWALFGLAVAAAVASSLGFMKIGQYTAMGENAAKQPVPVETVNMVQVEEAQYQPRISSVGSVVAKQGTDVSTEAEGVVRQILFEAGSNVKTGDLLVQLDVDIEMAQLREADATVDLARLSFDRAKELMQSKSIPQQEFDTVAINLKQAVAKIDNIKALIAKKSLRAPFDGKLGIRNISVGQYLPIGSKVVSLQALDPVFVEVSLPQQRLGDIAEGLQVNVTTDAYDGQEFNGKITAINPAIDPVTRNVRVQATFNNTDFRLRPGMFVSADILLSETLTVLYIPATAVQHAPFGDSVFLIEEQTTTTATGTTTTLVVQQQVVRLGARQGDFVVATEGVKLGDKIVSTGVFKLQPGSGVVIDNALAPKFELDPTPDNT